MKRKNLIGFTATLLGAQLSFFGCTVPETITIGEGNWDSNAFHDQVAKFIIEQGYGIEVDVVPADTAILLAGLKTGDVNITMEMWSENVPSYYDDINAGDYLEVGVNFDDNAQGLYIPKYLADQYPDLTTVEDLKDYAHLFPDPEDSSKGIIYGGPEGWEITAFFERKVEAYGLDEFFNFKAIDSSAALDASMVGAYIAEEPWVGYNWEPTWTLGTYDMVLLEDTAYSAENFELGIGEAPVVRVTIVTDKEFETNYPEIYAFLENYTTSSAITSAALAYMAAEDAEAEEAARWFLEEYDALWTTWVPEEIVTKVKAALE